MHTPHPLSQSLFRDPSHETLLIKQVSSLLVLGTVEGVSLGLWDRDFYSQYFLVPNPQDGMRPIFDLHGLNTCIKYTRFHIVTLWAILPSCLRMTGFLLCTPIFMW